MRSEPPPRRPDEQLRIATDPDFGAVRLVREWFHGRTFGKDAPTDYWIDTWTGRIGSVPLEISFYAFDAERPPDVPNVPNVPAPVRAVLLRLASQEAKIRLDIANDMIETAKNWADSGGLPEPTVASLAAALRLVRITVDDTNWKPALWFDEPAGVDGIFAGHGVDAFFEADGSPISYQVGG